MPNNSKKFVIILFLLISHAIVFVSLAEDNLEEQAIKYRQEGYKAQLRGDLSEALAYYKKATYLNPDYAEGYNDMGVVYEKLGNDKKALGMYDKAIRIDPNYLAVYTNLALFYEKIGDASKALLYWGKRYNLGKDEGGHWREIARQRISGGVKIFSSQANITNTKESRVKKTLDLFGLEAEPKGQPLIDEVLVKQRNIVSDLQNQIGSLKKENTIMYKKLAQKENLGGSRKSKIAEGVEKKEALPEKVESQESGKKNVYQDKIDTLTKEKSMLYEKLGSVYLQAQLYKEAIDAYSQSLSIDLNNVKVYYYLGLLYQQVDKDTKRAIDNFRFYLERAPYGKYRDKAKRLIKLLEEEKP